MTETGIKTIIRSSVIIIAYNNWVGKLKILRSIVIHVYIYFVLLGTCVCC